MTNSKRYQYHRDYYCENKATIQQQAKDSRERLRNAVYALLGEICQGCGFSDRRALQIDHVNGQGLTERRTLGSIYQIYRKILKMVNPEKEYQILCANCNWIKRVERNENRGSGRES